MCKSVLRGASTENNPWKQFISACQDEYGTVPYIINPIFPLLPASQ